MKLISLLRRLHPFYVPVHRSAVRAVNTLINTALRSTNTNILKVNNAEAIAIIASAIAAVKTAKDKLATQAAELTALRAEHEGNAAVVAALNTQIESLTAAAAEIDEALAKLAIELPQGEPVVPETETLSPDKAAEIEREAGAALAEAGQPLPDEASEAAKDGHASVAEPVATEPEAPTTVE